MRKISRATKISAYAELNSTNEKEPVCHSLVTTKTQTT